MSFERHGYHFEGAFTSAHQLDIGEWHNVQERVLNHDRAGQWQRNCQGTLHHAAHYTPNLAGGAHADGEQTPPALRARFVEIADVNDRRIIITDT